MSDGEVCAGGVCCECGVGGGEAPVYGVIPSAASKRSQYVLWMTTFACAGVVFVRAVRYLELGGWMDGTV